MKPWTEFYDTLLPDVPGCNPAMANIALRHAAREFCEKTLVWQEWRGPQSSSATSIEYSFDISTNEEVVKLLGATLDGIDLPVRAANDMPVNWMKDSGVPKSIVTKDRSMFYVVPKSTAGLLIETLVALKPSNKATGVTDEVFAHHLEVICTGAKARLMMSPKKPYTDMALAGQHAGMFSDHIYTVTRKVEKSFSRNPRRVSPMFF